MASQGYEEELLRAWFPDSEIQFDRKQFDEKDIREISSILERTSRASWSRIPRIYVLLRLANQLHAIDSFLKHGITDFWFPFTQRSLPEAIRSHSDRQKILDLQDLVYNTQALKLEQDNARHGHFKDPNDIPLKYVGQLGKGGSGRVDRVISTVTYKEYARKLIPRGKTFKKDKKVLQNFEQELSNLKRLSQSHRHIVELIGSYTEPKYVGIIMFPVAEYNLAEFMGSLDRDDDRRYSLRAYFGCLVSALGFMHDNNIRHKDIKPSNVLLKGDDVFFTDFGLSIDWTALGHSTTIGDTALTPRYASPEVASFQPRNSSSDIWSLGCVFLEMWTVLKGERLQALENYMRVDGQLAPYHAGDSRISSWTRWLRKSPGSRSDNVPLEWMRYMLVPNQKKRWSARKILEEIKEYDLDDTLQYSYIGRCCVEDEDTAESVISDEDECESNAITRYSGSTSHGSYSDLEPATNGLDIDSQNATDEYNSEQQSPGDRVSSNESPCAAEPGSARDFSEQPNNLDPQKTNDLTIIPRTSVSWIILNRYGYKYTHLPESFYYDKKVSGFRTYEARYAVAGTLSRVGFICNVFFISRADYPRTISESSFARQRSYNSNRPKTKEKSSNVLWEKGTLKHKIHCTGN